MIKSGNKRNLNCSTDREVVQNIIDKLLVLPKIKGMKLLSDSLAFVTPSEPLAHPFQPVVELPLVIMVGLTGVGKSTVLELLQKRLNFWLLPNRRTLTDEVIIALLQQEDGQPLQPVTDRLKRFEYTARYRTQYPGGMAHALSRLALDTNRVTMPLFFDGLRGLNEVEHGAALLPQARFVLLDAPDTVRLGRLLNRADAFDSATVDISPADEDVQTRLRAIPDIENVFTGSQLVQIARLAAQTSAGELLKKAAIIVEERRNYDSGAARDYLATHLSAQKRLVVDTAHLPPQIVTRQIIDWLERSA